ncbi:MAG: nicotinamidase [Actinomycetota bacterium]|nr:nicotinamidase [Actinomycetota bacterium]
MSRALIIVDYQNDFAAPDGALSVPGGEAIAERINELAASGDFAFVVATRDWHPPDHGSFITSDSAGPWPVHCVAGSPGAELHPALEREHVDLVLDKGTDPATEGYSAFDATGLGELLRERGVNELLVTGLATDVCVKHTTLDALQDGFSVAVDLDAVRGVDVNAGDSDRALDEMSAAGAEID